MRLGLALRPGIFSPEDIGRVVPKLDEWGFSSVWFNDSPTAIDTCALALGATKKARVATGVLRLGDYDPVKLASRIYNLNAASGNRFILGVGTGQNSGRGAIEQLVDLTGKFRAAYPKEAPAPMIYFSALRARMTRASFEYADGVLLNFTSPSFVEKILPTDIEPRKGFEVAGYVKLFYSRSDEQARKMLAEEFSHYNSIGNYHGMFEAMGLAKTIEAMGKGGGKIPEELLEMSRANPSPKELRVLLGDMRKAGVDLPVISVYADGDAAHKLRAVRSVASLAG